MRGGLLVMGMGERGVVFRAEGVGLMDSKHYPCVPGKGARLMGSQHYACVPGIGDDGGHATEEHSDHGDPHQHDCTPTVTVSGLEDVPENLPSVVATRRA